MSSADDPPAGMTDHNSIRTPTKSQVHSQLVEALVHVLVEKGVLTRNDALSVVQTVAQVKLGEAAEGGEKGAQAQMDVDMLQRMYSSFESLSVRTGAPAGGGKNVHQLRPPIYEGQPEFPQDD